MALQNSLSLATQTIGDCVWKRDRDTSSNARRKVTVGLLQKTRHRGQIIGDWKRDRDASPTSRRRGLTEALQNTLYTVIKSEIGNDIELRVKLTRSPPFFSETSGPPRRRERAPRPNTAQVLFVVDVNEPTVHMPAS